MNLDYELKYWQNDGKKKGIAHQREYCIAYRNFFEGILECNLQLLCRSGIYAEVGPGPFGGMALVLFPKKWVFIDPLMDEYKKIYDFTADNRMYISIPIEKANENTCQVDGVFCTNALDHTISRERAEKAIYSILKPKGLFFLVVHCRTKEELNEGHSQAFTGLELLAELEKIGFIPINYAIVKDRFIEKQRQVYNTLVGVFKK